MVISESLQPPTCSTMSHPSGLVDCERWGLGAFAWERTIKKAVPADYRGGHDLAGGLPDRQHHQRIPTVRRLGSIRRDSQHQRCYYGKKAR
jgi:hypothetical protein